MKKIRKIFLIVVLIFCVFQMGVMATVWDVSTITTYAVNVSNQDFYPFDVDFSPDGTNMYIMGYGNDTVYQYTLTTAWNVGTASYAAKSYHETQDSEPLDVAFSSDGTKMYIVGNSTDTIYQYTLTTPWDVSTAEYAEKSKLVSDQDTKPYGLSFSSDGTKMYIVGYDTNTAYQYTLTTAWNVDTASYATKSVYVGDEESKPFGVTFNPDGTKMYIIGIDTDTVYQYTLTTPWDVSTASYAIKSAYVGNQDTFPHGVAFSSDGTKMYIKGVDTHTVYQYTLTTAWNVDTASYATKSVYVGDEDFDTLGMTFSSDGTKMYIIEIITDTVYQYTLTTAWNISTASYAAKSVYVGNESIKGGSVAFSSDGTKMYIVGYDTNTAYQYTLTTAWDVSTASYATKSVYVGDEDTYPLGIIFSPDGTKMYIMGTSTDTVYQYTLTTAWDVSTASYATKSVYVGNQDTFPQGVAFSSDGSKMYMVGGRNYTVYQYTLPVIVKVNVIFFSTPY